MTRPTRLIAITQRFPWGTDDDPLALELDSLAQSFDEIEIVALKGDGESAPLPANARARRAPLLEGSARWIQNLSAAADPQAIRWAALSGPRRAALSVARAAARGVRLRRWVRRAVVPRASDVVYATTPQGAVIGAMLRDRQLAAAAVARLSSGDAEVPLLERAVERLDALFASSPSERERLAASFPKSRLIEVAPLGAAIASRRAVRSTDGVFRIVTAGAVEPDQRLRLLMSALRKCTQPIEWTHVGGTGSAAAELRQSCSSLMAPIQVLFLPERTRAALERRVLESPIDVFASFSETEPIGLELALAHGIPVLASRSDSACALVDDANGWLVDRNAPTAEIAARLQALSRIEAAEWSRRSDAALERWRRDADAGPRARVFAARLRSLSS